MAEKIKQKDLKSKLTNDFGEKSIDEARKAYMDEFMESQRAGNQS
jgi:hypothetical protein